MKRTEPPADDALITVAEVVKAVGLRGEVKLYPLLDFHASLLQTDFLVWTDGSAIAVRGSRAVRGGWVVAIVGVDDRDAAEALVGRALAFRRADYERPEFPRPPGGMLFRYLNRPVVTVAGHPLGTVVEVRRSGAQPLLVVSAPGGEILIPAVAPLLRPDTALTGPLVVDPPEGLLDVNA